MKRKFPIFLGTGSAQTSITNLNVDSNENIAFGGRSDDTSLVTSVS